MSGCGSLVERDTDGVVLFDIGGGSSEIALIDLSRQRTPRLASHIVSWTSLPLGVVSLAERFGGKIVSRDVFEAMVADVRGHLEAFVGRDRLDHVSRTPALSSARHVRHGDDAGRHSSRTSSATIAARSTASG